MLDQPNKLLFLTGFIFAILSFFVSRKTVEIHIHDTYFIFALNTVCWVLTAILFLYGLLYWWISNLFFSSFLTWAHVSLTVFLAVFLVTMPFWLPKVELLFSNDTFSAATQKWKLYRGLNSIIQLLVIGQVSFIINLIGGLFKGVQTSN